MIPGCTVGMQASAMCACGTGASGGPLLCQPGQWCHYPFGRRLHAVKEVRICDESGLAVFNLIRRHGALASAVHCAFDLLELDGRDLCREPIENRKALLAKLLKGATNEYRPR